MKRFALFAVRTGSVPFIVASLVAIGAACGPDLVFRAYLGKTLWHPPVAFLDNAVAGLPPESPVHVPYAGMQPAGAGVPLQAARDAYRALFPDQINVFEPSLVWPEPQLARVRDLVNSAQAANDREAAELDLLKCKAALRSAGATDRVALTDVRSCLASFLAKPGADALASEARGWMARVDFLLGNQPAAAKFYLDELRSTTSNIRRERLLASLLLIDPKEGDLDQYFDTPQHALFIATRITDRDRYDGLEAALVERLEGHRDLFVRGADSEALAVAMMRAATRMGAPQATLRYAGEVPSNAAVRNTAEYNWLAGTAHFAEKDYVRAATAFMSTFSAKDATEEHRSLAANALIGAYYRLQQPLDQLWAAFEALSHRGNDPDFGSYSLDAAYLLDVELSDAQLEAYLNRFANAPRVVIDQFSSEKPTSLDAVRYELAVRHSRAEQYARAADLYASLHSGRAETMRKAEQLFAATLTAGVSREAKLNALYDYASFLADNEDGIFFNDTIWIGFQTASFVSNGQTVDLASVNAAELSADERAKFSAQERRLQDVQEEYWKAYQILNGVVQEAGATDLGRKAANRAIVCLRRINIGRFGRAEEIRAADIRLSNWLARNR